MMTRICVFMGGRRVGKEGVEKDGNTEMIIDSITVNARDGRACLVL